MEALIQWESLGAFGCQEVLVLREGGDRKVASMVHLRGLSWVRPRSGCIHARWPW